MTIRGDFALPNGEWAAGDVRVSVDGGFVDALDFEQWKRIARTELSEFALVLPTAAGRAFVRGDTNDDGGVDLSDAVRILAWLFLGAGPPGCLASVDVNGDAGLDLSDAVALLSYLFLGGAPPMEPFPDCGSDGGAIGCEVSAGCA